MPQLEKGYYIEGGVTETGGINGPRARELWNRQKKELEEDPNNPIAQCGGSASVVNLVYGNPVLKDGPGYPPFEVFPVEKQFKLVRYLDPREQEEIYVTRFRPSDEPNTMDWRGTDDHATAIPATPALHAIFDVAFPEFQRQLPLFRRRERRAFREAMHRAGLTEEDRPIPPPNDASQEEHEVYSEASHRFESQVWAHQKPIKNLLVRVDEIHEALGKVEITPQPDYSSKRIEEMNKRLKEMRGETVVFNNG